ncbi:hypothetical protein IPA_06455 [Ignicoccus pacificus DSM 13166]|uniref:Uncharacterized protein n=1 Tax=Ignicoccus pacificus DSM 13166 TaxID=940294 RepID=A0A977KBI9_9CREN|nr:hypothetical protein IPA_06455 [Ignicoccus pacificus DSM 13166]
MRWLMVLMLIPLVSALTVVPVGRVSPGNGIELLIVIKGNGMQAFQMSFAGAHLPDGSQTFSWKGYVSGEKVIKLKIVAESEVVKITYLYDGFEGIGYLGKVPFPGTFVEVKVEGNKLLVRPYSKDSKVPVLIHFQNAYPVERVLKEKCLKEESKTFWVDYCAQSSCQLWGYGKLECVKWKSVWESTYSCVKFQDGKCVLFKKVDRLVKKCEEMRAKRVCLIPSCSLWSKRPINVRFCSMSKFVEERFPVRGSEALLKADGRFRIIQFVPKKQFYGPLLGPSEVKAPAFTILVGGIPYYTYYVTLVNAGREALLNVLLTSALIALIALAWWLL